MALITGDMPLAASAATTQIDGLVLPHQVDAPLQADPATTQISGQTVHQGDMPLAADAATTQISGEAITGFFIGLGDTPGLEFNDLALLGEWFANQDNSSGGEFGEPPPDNARIRKFFELEGHPALGGAIGDPSPVLEDQITLEIGFLTEAVLEDPLLPLTAEILNGATLDLFFSAAITKTYAITGDLALVEFPSLPIDVLVPVLGHRPCFPLVIRSPDVTHLDSVASLELYQPFLVSVRYTPSQGDSMSAFGAQPNSIGMRVLADVTGDGVETEETLFRRPLENEVVVVTPQPDNDDPQILRWNASSEAWESYKTPPERAIDSMGVFEVLDPQKIYEYVAQIFGLKEVQLQRDTISFLDFVDPQTCPTGNLPLLGSSFGAPIDANTDEAEMRATIRNWVPLMQKKGLPSAIPIALQFLGYSGYATHVWGRPNVDSEDESTDFQERPFNYNNELPDAEDGDVYHPLPQVVIHLNRADGSPFVAISQDIKQRVAAFLKQHVLPAHVRIRAFATDHETVVVADTLGGTDLGVVGFADAHVALVQIRAGAATVQITGSISPVRGTMALQAGAATVNIQGTVTS